jgi:hypothetical protein
MQNLNTSKMAETYKLTPQGFVDYNFPVFIKGVSDKLKEMTNRKFELWDNVLQKGFLEGTPEQQEYAYNLLNDYTIFVYAFFRDETGNPFKLYPYQDVIINDTHRWICFAAANQIGKSITLIYKAIVFALKNPGKTVLMVSRTVPQSSDLLRQIKEALRSSVLDYQTIIGDQDSKTAIYFKHTELNETGKIKKLKQSRIVCVPATEAALGYAADLVLEDEQAFYEGGEYFHFQIAVPRTYTTKGQVISFSNPNGQQGIFWKIWNDPKYHRYNFNFLDCPTNTRAEYDSFRQSMTRDRFESTIMGVFTSPEGGFISLEEREWIQSRRKPNSLPIVITQPLYIFFDWAKSRDRTVRIIGVPRHESDQDWADKVDILEMKEYPSGTSYSDIIDGDLRNLIKEVGVFNIAMVGWDNTGVGKGLEDFVNRLQQIGVNTMPVEFSLQNKSRIYTLFKLLIENKRIIMPFVDECDKQLSCLRFKKTSRGYLQVHHEEESDRDDFPDSIAGLCSLIIAPDNPPITCEII